MDLAKEATQFGPWAFMFVVFLFGAKWLIEKLMAVIENNTAAISKLCSSSEDTNTTLGAHDQRAERIEGTVNRIELKVDALHPAQGRKTP